jgi:hypothetical protein
MTPSAPSIDKILEQRGSTHGHFGDNALISQALKHQVRTTPGWHELNVAQKEAIDVIFLKISRILSGQASFEDHWLDIEGYARLGKESIHA